MDKDGGGIGSTCLVDGPIGGELKEITLRAFARKHLKMAGNDIDAAREAAIAEIESDEKLKSSMLREAVFRAIDWAVRNNLKTQRDDAVSSYLELDVEGLTAKAKLIGERAVEKARETVSSLMEYPMRCGTPLALANRHLIAETADFYWKQGRTCIQRALWLRAVAALLPSDTALVGGVISREKLQELFDKAEKKVVNFK